jgi:hypothetical protein
MSSFSLNINYKENEIHENNDENAASDSAPGGDIGGAVMLAGNRTYQPRPGRGNGR